MWSPDTWNKRAGFLQCWRGFASLRRSWTLEWSNYPELQWDPSNFTAESLVNQQSGKRLGYKMWPAPAGCKGGKLCLRVRAQGRPRPRVSSDSEAPSPDPKAVCSEVKLWRVCWTKKTQTSSGDWPTNGFLIRLHHCGTSLHKERSLGSLFLCGRLSGSEQSLQDSLLCLLLKGMELGHQETEPRKTFPPFKLTVSCILLYQAKLTQTAGALPYANCGFNLLHSKINKK